MHILSLLARLTSLVVAGAASVVALGARAASAQSLRGSPESVERMHSYAVAQGLPFYEAAANVRAAARRGSLVPLRGNGDYVLHRVAFPYVKPETRLFVERLAAQYRARCGAPMVVTSAVRPEDDQPANGSDESVHPTGIAVDIRKPRGACRGWMRDLLLSLEGAGVLEATEEFHPPHFHVAVFGEPYTRYVARLAKGADGVKGVKRVNSVKGVKGARTVAAWAGF